MAYDKVDYAGTWEAHSRLRPKFWEELDLRVRHTVSGRDAIVLVGSPWACVNHYFRDGGAWLDLTLRRIGSEETVKGSFDLARGVWKPEGGPELSAADWHVLYAGKPPPGPWPMAGATGLR